MVSFYVLDYMMWVCKPKQMEADFKEMKDMGGDAVCVTFNESDAYYSRRSFEILIGIAHKAGLKVYAIPSRILGRFAGAPLMPSVWLSNHPEYAVPLADGKGMVPAACLECPEVLEWTKGFLDQLLGDYAVDGLVWDEPKVPDLISHHPATVAKYGPNPTKENMMDSFCEFFHEITAYASEKKPGISQILFTQHTFPAYFTEKISCTPDVEYFGYDGNLCSQRLFHEEIHPMKYRIDGPVYQRTLEECKHAGKKSFALVENLYIPREEIACFEEKLEAYIKNCPLDHLCIYYYGLNGDAPDELNEAIKRVMKKHFAKCVGKMPETGE